MPKVSLQDVSKLEEQAAKAKAAYELKAAKVRRAQQRQRADHERAILQLLKSLGLTTYAVETLRSPFASIAAELQATDSAADSHAGAIQP